MNCCPTCKRPMPGVIVGGLVKQRIFDFVRDNPGMTINKIMDAVYWDDPNGGPDGNIRANIWRVNHSLEKLGYKCRVRASHMGHGATYSLVEVAS